MSSNQSNPPFHLLILITFQYQPSLTHSKEWSRIIYSHHNSNYNSLTPPTIARMGDSDAIIDSGITHIFQPFQNWNRKQVTQKCWNQNWNQNQNCLELKSNNFLPTGIRIETGIKMLSGIGIITGIKIHQNRPSLYNTCSIIIILREGQGSLLNQDSSLFFGTFSQFPCFLSSGQFVRYL